jgi:hypothetical protein
VSTNQTPAPTPTTTIASILQILQDAGGYVTLGVEVAGVVIPLVKAVVTDIKNAAEGGATETYTVLLTADAAALDAVDALALEQIEDINAYLGSIGAALIPVPTVAADPLDPPATTGPTGATPGGG